MMNRMTVLSVTQLNLYIKSVLEKDLHLSRVFLRGEISNFTNHIRSGHYYFALKDDASVVKAVMFRNSNQHLRFLPENGMTVLVSGRVSVYERDGAYQLYVDDMQPDGIGALALATEQLKRKLEAEGLFSAERKKPIPAFPKKIGVITSPTGAVLHDICNVLSRRFPLSEVVLCPALVQGAEASRQVREALLRFQRIKCVDVIIIARGGGSAEDLAVFNEEQLVRAVANCKLPTISAVGHETDITLCDFAADLRAPTPSAAAELAVPERRELLDEITGLYREMNMEMKRRVQNCRRRLEMLKTAPCLLSPMRLLEEKQMQVDRLQDEITALFSDKYRKLQEEFRMLCGKLEVLSPLSVLSRGYALLQQFGEPVCRASALQAAEPISVQMQDGSVIAQITEIQLKK